MQCTLYSLLHLLLVCGHEAVPGVDTLGDLGVVHLGEKAVHSVQCGVRSAQCQVCSVQCAVWSVQCRVCSVKCTVCTVQCRVCSVQCVVYSVQCIVLNVQCAELSVHRPRREGSAVRSQHPSAWSPCSPADRSLRTS